MGNCNPLKMFEQEKWHDQSLVIGNVIWHLWPEKEEVVGMEIT